VLAPHIRVSEAIKQPSIAACMYPEFESSIFEGLFCIIKRIGLGVLQNTSLTSNHAAIFLTDRTVTSNIPSCKLQGVYFQYFTASPHVCQGLATIGDIVCVDPNIFLSFFINSCEL